MKYLKALLIGLIILAVGVAIGRYSAPEKIVKVEVLKEATEDQSKKAAKKSTKKTTKTNVDGSTEVSEETSEEDIQEYLNKRWAETIQMKVAEKPEAQWMFGVGVGYSLRDYQKAYSVSVQRRIAGPLWAGLKAIPSEEYVEANASLEY